jgi:hypothetical protein
MPSRLGEEHPRRLRSLTERDFFTSEEKREIVFYFMILLIGEIIIASMAGGSSGVAKCFLGAGCGN